MQIEPARFVNRIAKQHLVVLASGDTRFLVTRNGCAIRMGEEGGHPIHAHAHRFFHAPARRLLPQLRRDG
jgi:hypothetical protein